MEEGSKTLLLVPGNPGGEVHNIYTEIVGGKRLHGGEYGIW